MEGYKKYIKLYRIKMVEYGFKDPKTKSVQTTESNDCKTPEHPEKVIALANEPK